MKAKDKVIEIARAELGYVEKASDNELDAFDANSGAANWTKYARDLAAAGYYQGDKNGFPWCDVFVDWCFYKAFGKIMAERIQCQTGPLGAGCSYSAQYYAEKGRFDKQPSPGDQVFFQTGSEIEHTGLVIMVTDTKIKTIEGNNDNAVQQKEYMRTDSYIAGYGHPLYELIKDEFSSPQYAYALPELRYGMKENMFVAAMQYSLLSRGYNIGSDGIDADFGHNTLSALKAFQIDNGLADTGICTPETWRCLSII